MGDDDSMDVSSLINNLYLFEDQYFNLHTSINTQNGEPEIRIEDNQRKRKVADLSTCSSPQPNLLNVSVTFSPSYLINQHFVQFNLIMN